MPLPPLPENNTERIFVAYTTGRNEHEFVMRVADGVSPTFYFDAINNFLSPLLPILPNQWQITGARRQEKNSLFSLPIDIPGLEEYKGTNAAALLAAELEPRQTKWTGRSLSTGRNVNVGLYGLIYNTPTTYRFVVPADNVPMGNARAGLDDASFGGLFVAIDGANVSWKNYTNVQFNSYWETRARA